MGRRKYRDERRHYRYVEAMVVDRVLDENTQSVLRMLPGQPIVTANQFSASVDWDDYTREMEKFVEQTFDAWLFFDNYGPRTVAFRIPSAALPTQAVAPHLHGTSLEGLCMETSGDDLLLRFSLYAEDSELFNLNETGAGWLHKILPVREELMSGRLDALELARVVGTHWDEVDRNPSAEYGLSKASRVLAAYLLVAPEELARLAAKRTEAGSVELPAGWLSACSGLEPVARWEFAAADPRKSFQITLGRLPSGCEYGEWYVTSSEPRGRPLAFRTEDDARRGYHDEALRLQRLNDPGRWRQLDHTV
ncbi:hypothetical protein [Microbispora siamensis]|uniref:Uncharacterized protein n=1 Tax=Microbispora siamensis TaxID=564413 RepID=A0ABQ4GJ79_9ACTN|nr:hypothetical protein [Microbispora siamensis]GIH61492.1 hypothetical protein Msi02_23090 [Microbispora siamensis]